jgi:hypothetical protein
LLDEMAANPAVLSRRRYVAQRPDDPDFASYGETEFDQLAGMRAKYLAKRALREIPTSVGAARETVKRHVDKHLAHHHPDPTTTLNFGQLREAIHELSAIYQRVGLILNAAHYGYVPVIQEPWEHALSSRSFPRSTIDAPLIRGDSSSSSFEAASGAGEH